MEGRGLGDRFWLWVNWASNIYFLAGTVAVAVIGLVGGIIHVVTHFGEPWRTVTTVGAIGVALSLLALVLRVGRSRYYRRKLKSAAPEEPLTIPPNAIFTLRGTRNDLIDGVTMAGVTRENAPTVLLDEGGEGNQVRGALILGPRQPRFSIGDTFDPGGLATECLTLSDQLHEFLGERREVDVIARNLPASVPRPLDGPDSEGWAEYQMAWQQSRIDSELAWQQTINQYDSTFEGRVVELYERLEEHGLGNERLAGVVRRPAGEHGIEEVAQEFGVIGQRLQRLATRLSNSEGP
jgi:hypothetical protein